jgi:hypothetical protein
LTASVDLLKVPLGLKMRIIDMYEDSMGLRTTKDKKECYDENIKELILCDSDPLNQEHESVDKEALELARALSKMINKSKE